MGKQESLNYKEGACLTRIRQSHKFRKFVSFKKRTEIKRRDVDKKDMKTDLKNVILTDKCRATIAGHDEWVLHGKRQPTRLKR